MTVVCPAHPDAPRRHEIDGVEVRRVRFAPARVEARVALGESYRVFSGLSALWVIPMIARLALTAARQARRRPSAVSSDSARRVNPAHIGPVIHGHWWFPCGLVAVVAAMAAGRHAASVVQVHGSDAAVTTNAVHRWLARRVLRRAGAVVTVSEDLRDWAASLVPRRGGLLLRRAGAVVTASESLRDWAASLVPRRGRLRPTPSAEPDDRCTPLRAEPENRCTPPRAEPENRCTPPRAEPENRCTPPRAEPENRRRGPLLRVVSMPVGADRLGAPTPTPPDGPVVAVGRLMTEKGFDVLIEAVARMPRAERPAVVIVGEGPDRTLLAALALRRGVIVQFAGAVAPGEIGDWYRRARLVCVPSRREGFGMVVAEALATGRWVVATRVGAAPQFIAEGINGYLVPPDDATALAEALAAALGSDDAATLRARADAPAPIGPQAHAAALLDLYVELAETSCRAGRRLRGRQ